MKYDIYSVHENSLNVEVVGGKIHSNRNKNISKKGVRLFDQQKIYTTSVVGNITDEALLTKARENKTVGIPFEYEIPAFKSMSVIDEESFQAPLHTIIENIKETQELLAPYSKDFVFNGKFNRSIYSVDITNESGQKLSKKYASNSWYYLFKKVGSPNILDGYFGESGKRCDIKSVLDINLPFVKAYNKEIKFQNKKMPVLFLEEGTLMDKLSESLLADKYSEGSALFSGKLGQKLFNDQFSLYDLNYSPDHSIYRSFDEEGSVRSQALLPLIDKGTFKNVICDLRNAKKYGLTATGNGSRSFDSSVSLGFNSLVLGKGARTTKQILDSLDECIVVFMGNGGDFTDSGDFSTPLQLSFLLNKGEIVGRLPQLTVKTTTQDMFGSRFMEIASDGFQKDSLNPCLFTEMDVFVN